MLDEPVPEGYSRWNGRLLAEHLGDVSKDQVWRVIRKHDIQLERRKSWCVSTDPEFSRKAADVVGLYLNPPQQNAVVLCVDEKPHIQALERAQGWIRLPNGRALTGFSHEYERHGTTTLFAALEIATGFRRGSGRTDPGSSPRRESRRSPAREGPAHSRRARVSIPTRPRVDNQAIRGADAPIYIYVRACEGQHFRDEAVDPELVQEQFDDNAEALRAQNNPERKSERDASPSGRS
jgi:hypothetical protein